MDFPGPPGTDADADPTRPAPPELLRNGRVNRIGDPAMDRLHLDPSSSQQPRPEHRSRGRADADTHKARKDSSRRGPLKFPEGGVFGVAVAPVMEQVEDALTIARGIEQRLNQMQLQLNELEAELDDPYVFPLARLSTSPHDTRPMAA
jgi:hypothetical protein